MNEDFSNIFEKFNIDKDSISPEMINNIMGMLNNSNNISNDTAESASPNMDIDVDTLLKMKSIIDKMNNNKNNDPRSRLLNSLRPYLKQNKQSKLDQYIQLMNMSKLIDILPFIGGDNNGIK